MAKRLVHIRAQALCCIADGGGGRFPRWRGKVVAVHCPLKMTPDLLQLLLQRIDFGVAIVVGGLFAGDVVDELETAASDLAKLVDAGVVEGAAKKRLVFRPEAIGSHGEGRSTTRANAPGQFIEDSFTARDVGKKVDTIAEFDGPSLLQRTPGGNAERARFGRYAVGDDEPVRQSTPGRGNQR